MKRLLALHIWGAAYLCHAALPPARGKAPHIIVARSASFLAKRDGAQDLGEQPWLYNPPPAMPPRAKPMEMPGGPLVLPPVDAMWGMQPSQSPPTIEPPEKKGDVGLQATIPPVGLDGWYATIPPKMIEDGLVDNRTAYYVRCLGGPAPCPFTVPPAVLRYWMPVSQAALANAEASTTLADTVEAGAQVLNVATPAGMMVGREVIIDAGTPIQEINFIAGFGSLILKFPLKYAHLKGILITMPKPLMTTPAPLTMPPFPSWARFQPVMPFNLWAPGPGPAPFPGPAPAPLPGPFLPMLARPPFPGPAPGPSPLLALARPIPAPAPAPFLAPPALFPGAPVPAPFR